MAAGVPGTGIFLLNPFYFYVHSKQNLRAFSNMRTHFVEFNSPSEKSEVLKRARCLLSLAGHVTDMFYLKFKTKQNKKKTALHVLRAAIRKLKKLKCFGTGAGAPAQQHLASSGLSQELTRTQCWVQCQTHPAAAAGPFPAAPSGALQDLGKLLASNRRAFNLRVSLLASSLGNSSDDSFLPHRTRGGGFWR